MMALAGIVFAIAFVMVQFGATAYSPRLVVVFGNDPWLYHTLGVFFASSLFGVGGNDRSCLSTDVFRFG
jgi:uncharacterized membrane protein